MKQLTGLYRFLYCCFIFFTGTGAASQKILHYEQYTSERGLSENVVYSVLQDKRGFVWAGTHHGLNRFDGYSFKKFHADKNDSTSLSQNEIYYMKQDEEGKLWIATGGGANYFNPETGKSVQIEFWYGEQKLVPSDFHIINRDSILILSANLVFLYKRGDNTCTPVETALHTNSNRFFVFSDGRIGMNAHTNEVLVYNKGTNRMDLLKQIPGTAIQPQLPITNYFFDGRGNHFLFNFSNTIDVFNKEGKLLARLDEKRFPPMQFVVECNFSVAESGIVYIGTTRGLVEYDPNIKDFDIIDLLGDSQSLKGNKEIRAVCIDKDQNLWLGIFGEGLLKCKVRQSPFLSISLEHLAPKNVQRMIFGLYSWPGGEIAAETGFKNFAILKNFKVVGFTDIDKMSLEEIVLKTTGKKISTIKPEQYKIIKSLYEKNLLFPNQFLLHDSVSIIQTSPTLSVVKADTVLSLRSIYSTFVMDDGNFYWAPTTGGLLKVDKKNFSDTLYTYEPGNENSLNENYTYHVIKDENNNLWIGTKGGGLNFFNRSENKFYHYTAKDGLPDDVVYFILPDKRGNLWLTTNRGLSKFNIKAKTFTNYSRRDGLLNSEFNRNGGLIMEDGTIWFSGTNGIDYFKPSALEGPQEKPGVFISDIRINSQEISIAESNKLKHSENNITISFTANDFTRPDLVYYRYRLYDTDPWTRVQGINSVTYNALSHGKYHFAVQSSYDNFNWSNAAEYSFVIITPWWKTTWFYLFVTLIICSLLYAVYKYRINQLKKIHWLRTKISRDLHDEVGATLSSIHVYSSVAEMSMDDNPGKAKDALNHINLNTRQVMENMNDIVWAIKAGDAGGSSLEGKLKNYGYELLTPLNISCLYHIDKEAEKKLENLEARKNILLIAKEAMNNIAKHSAATQTTIRVEINSGFLLLRIEDNGKGIQHTGERSGNGLLNMKQRTESMEGKFYIISNGQKGTIIECSVPIANISS